MSATLDSKTIFWLNWLGLIWMITFFSGSLAMYSKHVYIYIFFLSESSQKGTGKESFAEILDSVRSNLWKELPEFCEGHGSGEKKDETVVLLCIGLIWMVVSNIFYFHPYLGKIPNLTNIFQMGWNHQPDDLGWLLRDFGDFPFLFVCSIYIYIQMAYNWQLQQISTDMFLKVFFPGWCVIELLCLWNSEVASNNHNFCWELPQCIWSPWELASHMNHRRNPMWFMALGIPPPEEMGGSNCDHEFFFLIVHMCWGLNSHYSM